MSGPRKLARNRWLREITALGWPIVLYWMNCLLGLACFVVAIALTEDFDLEDIGMTSAMGVGMVAGIALGQVASITRVRSCLFTPLPLIGILAVFYVLGLGKGTVEAALGDTLGPMLVLGLMMFFFMIPGGFWSLRVNRGLMAAWAPAILYCGAIIIITEDSGMVERWHEGAKYAIWSGGTALILLTAVVLQILFMAARERHRLHRWRTAPQAPELVETRRDPVRPLSGLGTMMMLGLLMVVLTGASAIVAPYLWRTGPGDGNGGGGQIEDPADPADGGGSSTSGPGMPSVSKQIQRGVSMVCSLVTMLILALIGLFVFGIPVRRQLLLTHLRDPLWPVPPSRRARLHWRLAEIALGDMGVERRPGEAARDVALRAVGKMKTLNLEALVTAAEISDRVSYGYALDANDADTIRRAAEMTYQAVWESLGELQRLKATYRFL